jgi:hypothetical protein
MENKIKDNIPHKDFAEAVEKGIIDSEPIFTLNGIKYHTFSKGLQMINANRYLLYQQDLQSYQAYGMSIEISKDYVAEMIEHQDSIEKAIRNEDMDMIRKYFDDLKLTTLVYKEHQTNFNVISAILELNAIAFIAPCENPHVIDFDYMNKKILYWGNALASVEGGDFLSFFWKLTSLKEQDWMQSLMPSILHQAIPMEQLSEIQKNKRQIEENILVLDIIRAKRHIADLLASKSSLNHARQLRITSNYLKLKLKDSISSNIFNIP